MKAMRTLDEHDPLVLVARTFRSWRYGGGRTGRHTPIPLQRIACLVCRWHPYDQVAYELGLSVALLRSWQHDGNIEPCRCDQPLMSFVSILPMDPAGAHSLSSSDVLVAQGLGMTTARAPAPAP